MVTPDKEQLLLQEIQLLTVRERRMLKRIEMLKNMEQPTAMKILSQKNKFQRE